MDPQPFYDQVASELMAGPPRPGLWARAYALADGDLAKARARYINLRASHAPVGARRSRRNDLALQGERQRRDDRTRIGASLQR